MDYKKIKNGMKIVVKKWDNKITLTNNETGEIIKETAFGDHIQAVLFAKKL